MQAARSAFLTQDRDWRRKLQETFVTYRLEREFTKQEILALYLNVIFFGQRAYGVAAAAETYFGKQLDELTLGEAATLARVPQSPSRLQPDHQSRRTRRSGADTCCAACASSATSTPRRPKRRSKEVVRAKAHGALADVEAPYVAEMVRLEILKRFGTAAQDAGYKVYTTIDGRLQKAANRALRIGPDRLFAPAGLARRHQQAPSSRATKTPDALEILLDEYPSVGMLQPAIVISVAEKQARVYVKGSGLANIEWAGHVVGKAARFGTRARTGPEDRRRDCSRAATWSTWCPRRPTVRPSSRRCRTPKARSWLSTPTTAPSCRWWAASITSKARASTTA